MRALFVGLGSIGTRHLKNLHDRCAARGLPISVDALRSSDRPLPQETAALLEHQYTNSDKIGHYDLMFIANPTNLHLETIRQLGEKADTLFIEKPIFDDGMHSLEEAGLVGRRAQVAAPMRYCGAFLALQKELWGKRVYSARLICSSYLPDWRPGVDYRTVYSARREMGGGVTIDLIHEWDYLVDLFGFPLESCNFRGTYSDLEITSDDLSVYIARYPTMLAEIHLDYFGRSYRRTAEFFVQEGTITADFGAGTLTRADGSVVHCEEPVNERYLREMDDFLDFAQGKRAESANPPEMALRVLRLTLGQPL